MNTRSQKHITVGPEHPAWLSLDDDDWNGATFSNWLRTIEPGVTFTLDPPANTHPDDVRRMKDCLERSGAVFGSAVYG